MFHPQIEDHYHETGFDIFYIPLRKERKIYTQCPLCNAIKVEDLYLSTINTVILFNKYPVTKDSKLLVDRKHTETISKDYFNGLYRQIKEDDLIGLYDDVSTMSVPGHVHVELLPRRYLRLGLNDFEFNCGSDFFIYQDYHVPLLVLSRIEYFLFKNIFVKLKKLDLCFNILFLKDRILFHFLRGYPESGVAPRKGLGAKECVGIFSTSDYEKYLSLKDCMKETLINGSYNLKECEEVLRMV
ncbi:hypothetical protein CO178_01160 [candidate division WWE3 bacterium CG_4_9_14_3_um_filter_34_6]|uniref:Galactose-1-phosphate uridyl transferase N-terminal domain-containing protein n=1 Tax=candidate division WWE3 bacterium CG_4_9_14_3_um_filter_34_6 TaxID=1975079 RepID=A0A2M7X4Q6_UNCKA|nr:MAG: hypothetical protein CO178_01160 [candidate division WWE3 bacterium CG_4_9_14_3_um_filter_34_6]